MQIWFLANGDPRSIGKHPCCDIHRSQLLEEQLRSIGDVDLRDLRLVFTRTALKGLLREVPEECQQQASRT